MKLLFSIYTNKDGHEIVGFEPFNKNGISAFDQAIQSATEKNSNNTRLFMLTEIPIEHETVLRMPSQWESFLGIEIIDSDGWCHGSELGAKSRFEPITRAEFKTRISESTIREHDFVKA